MDKIRDNLYVGNAESAHKAWDLKKCGINSILNIAYEVNDPVYDPRVCLCIKVGLLDSKENKVFERQLAIDILTKLLQDHRIVLVHCGAGLSRAVFIASMSLASIEKKDPHDVFEEIRKARPFAMKGDLWHEFGYKPIGYEEKNSTD